MSELRVSGQRIAATVLVLVVAACTGARSTQTPAASPSSPGAATAGTAASASPVAPPTGALRYLVEQPENPADLDPLKAHLKDFEKATPGVTVTLDALPLEAMRTVLQTQLRSDKGPDVFAWGSGPAYAGALANAGLLYDLTQAYDQYKWPIYDFAKKQVTYGGKLVGVPGEMETIGIYYNKNIFSDLGIAQPQNLADLEAAAQKIKAANIIPFAMADKEAWEGSHWLSMSLSSRVGSAGMADLISGKTPWDSPDVSAALSIWDRWNKAGFFPKTPTGIGYDDGNALYFSGKAAMVPTGSWLVNDIIAAKTDFETGYIPFPSETGPGIFSGGLGSGPYISAKTKHPEAALAFVNWLVSPDHGRWVVENFQTIPPFPIDTSGLKVNPLFAQALADTAKFAGGNADFGSNIDVQSTDVFNNAMFKGIQALLIGQKTPDQIAQELDAAYKKK